MLKITRMQKQACTDMVVDSLVLNEVKQDKCGKKENEEGNPTKKSLTASSVHTAPSKVSRKKNKPLANSFDLNEKPKEQIVDIDAADASNEHAAVEYVEDIYKFYKLVESDSHPHDYMNSQPELDEDKRAILVNWLISVHQNLDLSLETLYLTINIIDRFFAVESVSTKDLQLVGLTSMLIASKYEKIWATKVNGFVRILEGDYTPEQILVVEKIILSKLNWNLTVPTPCVFLLSFMKASFADEKLGFMIHFLSELGMVHYATVLYCPSIFAASVVLAARYTLSRSPAWTDTLKLHTVYLEEQLIDCARLLVSFHAMAEKEEFPLVYRKYSTLDRYAVALMPPATMLCC